MAMAAVPAARTEEPMADRRVRGMSGTGTMRDYADARRRVSETAWGAPPETRAAAAAAIAQAIKMAPGMATDQILLLNLSGRGDKDIHTVADAMGVEF